jgi:hypothetical protein
MFFFEKRTKEPFLFGFMRNRAASRQVMTPSDKSFCFFFSEKEAVSCCAWSGQWQMTKLTLVQLIAPFRLRIIFFYYLCAISLAEHVFWVHELGVGRLKRLYPRTAPLGGTRPKPAHSPRL